MLTFNVVLLAVNVLLLLVTAHYAWTTRSMLNASRDAVSAMREQSEAMNRPYVVARTFIPAGYHVVYLSIANTGRSPAKNLRLSTDRVTAAEDLSKAQAFREAIVCFPPGAELVFGLTPAWQASKEHETIENPMTFSVTAEYEHGDRRFKEVTKLDIGIYAGSRYPHDPVQHELEKIAKAVSDGSAALSRAVLSEAGQRRS